MWRNTDNNAHGKLLWSTRRREEEDKRGGEEVGEEEEEGGWVLVDKTTDLPGFPDLGRSGEEGWLEQDGKVCDKRNSSDFIVPPRHTTNVSFETRSNVETQDGGLQNELMQQRESGCGEKNMLQLLASTEVAGLP